MMDFPDITDVPIRYGNFTTFRVASAEQVYLLCRVTKKGRKKSERFFTMKSLILAQDER